MTVSDLFTDTVLVQHLRDHAPASPHTGRPLTLVDCSHWIGLGPEAHREGPVDYGWENCMEPQWWAGAASGIYTHQVQRAVSDEELLIAARCCGYPEAEVRAALADRAGEHANATADARADLDALRQADRLAAEQREDFRRRQDALMPGWVRQPGRSTWRKDGLTICWNSGSYAIDQAGRRLVSGYPTPAEAAAAITPMA